MVGRGPFKGRALKPLHLNAVKDKEEGKDQDDEEKKVRVSLKNGTEKDRKKRPCGKCQGSTRRQQQQHHHCSALPQQQQVQRKEQQRRAHEIGDDQHKFDMADSIMSSRHASRGIAESGRLSSLTASKRYQPMGSNTVDKSSGITVQRPEGKKPRRVGADYTLASSTDRVQISSGYR